MAPRKSRQSQARKTGQDAGNPKTKRAFTGSVSDDGGNPSMETGAGGPADGPSHLTENRPDFPCSLSLSNLVRLDWQHRQELFPHGPGAGKLESLGFKGRAYNVESLEPGATGNKFVYLYPEKRYYVVPIYEEGQSPDAPQRFLLVRSREDKEEPGPHIFVVEPREPPAPDEPFAHLHVIGGEDDSAADEAMQHTAGIVEAVVTAVETTPEQQIESPAPLPPQPIAPSVNDPLVDDLLSGIDVLSIAQSSRPDAAHDFDVAHNRFLDYVQRHYGLEHIPITLGQTMFDSALGHDAKTTANNPALPEDVIVGVLRDGYRRDQKVVREAHVVVNKPDTTTAQSNGKGQITLNLSPAPGTRPLPDRLTRLNKLVTLSRRQMYLEISARQNAPIDEVILDADKQVGVIDVLYSLLAIFALAEPAKVHALVEHLNSQTAASAPIRAASGQIPSLHVRYIHRTPEMYIALKGTTKLLDALKQILVSEAAGRSGTNDYRQADRTWLDDLLRQLRPDGLTAEDYKKFADDISKRLEQLTFTAEFSANTSQ